MATRPGNNPKRRIAPPSRLADAEKTRLLQRIRYVGSGHHKRRPADYGLPRANPRPTKSLCDLVRVVTLNEARLLMGQGIRSGLISEPGEYHGYPLEKNDVMRKYVKSIWRERCRATGR
jgi:hypothetical protein